MKVAVRTRTVVESRRKAPLPASWNAAAGLLRAKKSKLAAHLRSVRSEWK